MKSLAQIEASGKWLKLFAAQDFYQTIALARAMHPNATEHVIAMEAQYLLRQLMHEIGFYVSRIPKRPAQLRPSHVARCTGYRRATGTVKAQRTLTSQEAKEMAMNTLIIMKEADFASTHELTILSTIDGEKDRRRIAANKLYAILQSMPTAAERLYLLREIDSFASFCVLPECLWPAVFRALESTWDAHESPFAVLAPSRL